MIRSPSPRIVVLLVAGCAGASNSRARIDGAENDDAVTIGKDDSNPAPLRDARLMPDSVPASDTKIVRDASADKANDRQLDARGMVTDDAAADRAPEACNPPPGPLAASIFDSRTCLLWQKEAGAARTNVQAAQFCDQLVADQFSDWRVPTPEELATWPNLSASSNAYVTNPTYIPAAGTEADGCTGNAHSCNLAEYNPGSIACAWQGVGFAGPTVCVRATARAGSTSPQYAAINCEVCKTHVAGMPAEFKSANCLPYAK